MHSEELEDKMKQAKQEVIDPTDKGAAQECKHNKRKNGKVGRCFN
jgi:hypothetical protein